MKTLISCLAALLVCLANGEDAVAQISFEQLPNGNIIPDGFVLTNELLFSDGVIFPDGVIVRRCVADPNPGNDCDGARSGQNVARSQVNPRADLSLLPMVIEFNGAQRFVALYVNGVGPDQMGVTHVATLEAFDAAGNRVTSQTRNFTSSTSWPTEMRVTSTSQNIKRVRLTGGTTFFPTGNWLMVDDLSFERRTPPGVDTTPPTVSVDKPANGETVTGPNVDITVSASDDLRLQSVDMQLRHVPTGNIIKDFTGGNVCGSGTCPEKFISQLIPFNNLTLIGEYQITVRARDAAGNSAEARSNFILNLPPQVFVSKVELNQAVQNFLENAYVFGRAGRIIPNKDLVVRYYLFAVGAPRPNYSASLIIRIDKQDGSTINRTISPNAGTGSITVDADPGDETARFRLRVQQRANLSRTLNFVIPGEFLNDATFMELRLWDSPNNLSVIQHNGISGDAAFLGLNIIRVQEERSHGAPATDAEIDSSIIAYLKRAYPVSDVEVFSRRAYRWRRLVKTGRECWRLLFKVWWNFGWDDAPVRIHRPSLWTATLGVIRTLRDCGGMAWVWRASRRRDENRVGGTAITTLLGDIAAQEIAHTMELVHASNDHGEAGGGDFERWPYPHGAIGPGGNNFGTIITRVITPSLGDAGQWQINLVDPCPTSDIDQRLPDCTLDHNTVNTIPHDFMSYGTNRTNLSPLVTKGRWVSDITYDRIYSVIRFDIFPHSEAQIEASAVEVPDPIIENSPAARVEAMMIGAEISVDGTIELLPIQRKLVPEVALDQEGGPYTLEVYGATGNLLATTSFNSAHASDPGKLLRVVAPYQPAMKSIVIRDGSGVVIEKRASANAPQVRVLSPNGGEVWQSGTHIIRWEGSDADGDTLSYLVQYSPDNGVRWQGIGEVEDGDSTALEFEVDELIPGNVGIIRITASDGLNTTVDQSDRFFTMGQGSGTSSVIASVGCFPQLPNSCAITLPITIDVSPTSPAELLGSFTSELRWNPNQLRYTGHSGLLSGFTGIVNPLQVAQGRLTFNGTNANGAGGAVEALRVNFEVVGAVNDTGSLALRFSAMSAAHTFTNLLPQLAINNCHYTIIASSALGDVNNDGLVNVADALIILSYDVNLAISEVALQRIQRGVGDVNGDGSTNSTDALIILAFDAGMSVPFPLGKGACP